MSETTQVVDRPSSSGPPPEPQPAPPTTFIAGIAICINCHTRFRVQQKHLALVGKAIKCPKCHREFVLKIETPTAIEQAAIKNAEEPEKKRRKVRTKTQIRRHRLSAIKKAMRPFHARLTQLASQDKCSEEQVRVWVIDVLRNVLGYKDSEIDTEMYALNQRIDIVLKQGDKVFVVIECKNTRSKLPANTINQAIQYAASKSADWAVVTSGQVWKLLRVFPVKGADPRTVEVFDLSLLDADGCSDGDVENLYLLTSRALFKGETERRHHHVACTSNRSMLGAIATPRVVKAIRRSLIEAYQKSAKERVKLTPDEVEERIREIFLPPDLSDPPSAMDGRPAKNE
jgi:predicted Zn finger-like uncharacterized protein